MITLNEFLDEARSALNVMDPRNFDRTGKKRAKPRTDKQMKADAWVDEKSNTGKPYRAQTEKLLDKGMNPRIAYAIAAKRRAMAKAADLGHTERPKKPSKEPSQLDQIRRRDSEEKARRAGKKPKSDEEVAAIIDRHKVAETEKWSHQRRKKTAAAIGKA